MPQELKINRMLWLDILVFSCIIEHTDINHAPPTKRQLFKREDRSGIINQFLQSNDVDGLYSQPLTSDLPVQDAMNKLRRLGFLETVERKFIAPTDKGRDWMSKMGANWRKWPLTAPITDNDEISMKQAIFMLL